MNNQFNDLMAHNQAEQAELKARFTKAVKKWSARKHSLTIEYSAETDYLYLTFGNPREGMALFGDVIVVRVEPETLEPLSVEIPNASRVDDPVWQHFVSLAKDFGAVYLPGEDEAKHAEERIARSLAAV